MDRVKVTYFSDVLCIWAYVAQPRLDALKREFGDRVELDYRFCQIFGDARRKIEAAWKDRDGLAGYNRHVMSVAGRFPHVQVDPQAWVASTPASSLSPHIYLAAVASWERAAIGGPGPQPILESATWALRRGFFAEARDIARRDVQRELVRPHGVDLEAVEALLADGSAHAAVTADYLEAERLRIEGSPTFVLNAGRQKLYGNVGFRVIEANLREIMREPDADQASWC